MAIPQSYGQKLTILTAIYTIYAILCQSLSRMGPAYLILIFFFLFALYTYNRSNQVKNIPVFRVPTSFPYYCPDRIIVYIYSLITIYLAYNYVAIYLLMKSEALSSIFPSSYS